MTFFEDRGGAPTVEDLLAKAAEAKCPLLMSVVNWGEVYYSVWRTRGEGVASGKLREIAQLPIEIVNADFELTRLAASLKAVHGLPYAGCFAAALAQSRKAPLVTSDRDLSVSAGRKGVGYRFWRYRFWGLQGKGDGGWHHFSPTG